MRVVYVEDTVTAVGREWAERLTQALERAFVVVSGNDFSADDEADIIFFAVSAKGRHVQRYLNASRALRCPYIFITPQMRFPAESVLTNVLAPVTMLEEEVHKSELLGHLMRYTGTSATLMPAHDYGSRARNHAAKIRTFIQARAEDLGRTFDVREHAARTDSMSLYKEVTTVRNTDMIVWTASRDYGLDDLLFGPAERKIILRSAVPVALLNPRGDLYSLCD